MERCGRSFTAPWRKPHEAFPRSKRNTGWLSGPFQAVSWAGRRLGLALVFSLGLSLGIFPSHMSAQQATRQPSFDFRYLGESLVSLPAYAEQLQENQKGSVTWDQGGSLLDLVNPVAGRAQTYSFSTPVQAQTEYLFRIRVKSAGPVIARIGALSMSYNDLGNWQTVTGLYRGNQDTSAEIRLELRSLDKQEKASAQIAEISFIPVGRPSGAVRRPFPAATGLVSNGKPAAAVIIPGGSDDYAKLGNAIAEAVEKKTGVALRVVTDIEATASDYPVLKEPYRSMNLILVGRLGNNRAFWAPYNRFLTAVDGYYPGGDGYALHTAANVFHTGFDHLIVGATRDAGAARAVEKLIETIGTAQATPGNLSLPWLQEIDLQGDCLKFFQAENAKWEETPENGLLPKPEPGYGNVVRWYQNAMGQYWTGWPGYQKRAQATLAQLLEEKANTHHYIAEFLVRTFDMVDETGLLSPEQVGQFDALVVSNFLDFMTVTDLSWMTTFAPPYGQIGLVNRHQIAPWFADYKMAEFISEILLPEGGLKELVEFRRQEKERTLVDFVKHRSGPSLPGGLSNETYGEGNSTFFRFALEKELYSEFFASGNAHKTLALERVNPLTGMLAFPAGTRDTKLLLGVMACLTGQPEYKWLWNHLPEATHARGYFQGRYLGQVRRYSPDEAAPESVPKAWSGIRFAPNPVENSPVKADRENYYFLSYGSGFAPDDDYLGFNGVSHIAPSGMLGPLISNGVSWLVGGVEEGGRFHLNSASAIRTDGGDTEAKFDDQSRCVWSGELPGGSALRFRQLLLGGLEWTRDLVVMGKGFFVFRDEFTALESGAYALNVSWHPVGLASVNGAVATFITRDAKMELTSLGDGFSLKLSQEPSGKTSLRSQALKRLKKGESTVVYSVLQTAKNHAQPFASVRASGKDRLTLHAAGVESRLYWNLGPEASGLGGDAALIVESAGRAAFFHGSRLTLEGKALVKLSTPGSFSVSPSGGWHGLPAGEVPPAGAGEQVIASLAGVKDGAPGFRQEGASAASAFPDGLGVPVTDHQKEWHRAWEYDGLLRPAKVASFRLRKDGILDFQKELELTEIRSKAAAQPHWAAGTLPQTILLALGEKQEGEFDWKPATGQRIWRPGIRTANYGEAHPEPRTDEALLMTPTRVRYVKVDDPSALTFFSASQEEARHPVKLEAGDFLRNGKIQTLVASDVFPQFPRPLREDDLSAALLDENGQPLFELDFKGPVQAIRLLDREGKGRKELFVLYANGTLEIYALDGKLLQSADLYKLHQEFQKQYGRENTRQPAGGFVLPFSVGVWRGDALTGKRRVVIGRYGGFSFLDPQLALEGVLNSPGYATPAILEEGVDFGGEAEEQVVAERLRIWHLGGNGTPVVRDPHGARFWPQVYDLLKVIPEDEASRVPLGGMPTQRFELLKEVTGKPRLVLLARGTTLSLYDGQKKAMHYSWNGEAPITGAGILVQSEGKLELVVATGDSLLWHFAWTNGLEAKPVVSARLFPDVISSIAEAGGAERNVVLSGAKGLYLLGPEGDYRQIASGAYHAAVPTVTEGRLQAITATSAKGEVLRFTPAKTPQMAAKERPAY